MFSVDNAEKIVESVKKIYSETKDCPLIAVDLEYYALVPGDENTCIMSLIQISTLQTDYIFDCFLIRDYIRANNT